MTVAALDEEMDAEELVGWQAFFKLREEDRKRAERRAKPDGA